MKELLEYVKPYKKYVFLAPLFMIIEVASELFMPKLMTKIISVGVANNDLAYIGKMGAFMIFLAIIGILGGVGCLICASYVSQKSGADIRSAVFTRVQHFSFSNLDKFKTSSIIIRLTNDITQIQMVVLMSLRMLIRAPLLFIGGIMMALTINKQMTIVFFILVPVVTLVIYFISKKAMPLFKLTQDKLDKVNTVMRENLSGVRVVKAFVREDYEKKKFSESNSDYKDTTIKAFKTMVMTMPAMMLIANIAIIAILWFGGLKVQSGSMKIEEIMAFITYLTQMLMALMMIAMVLLMVSRAKVSADRLSEILTEEIDIKNGIDPVLEPLKGGNIEFKNVKFSYPGEDSEPVLEDISLKINAGETIGILGSTGSGKSTLVNLIPRLYDISYGEILVDGIDVRKYDLDTLRNGISFVLQETVLFSGSIKDNIKWGRENATDEEVIEAAKIAQAHDFILAMPNGYDTELGQRGVNLSGGQKQRISIARAIIKNPKILIFDDSTSAVDMVTEKKIQVGLKENKNTSTKIIIAQRISSIADADKIFLINDGRISASGKHSELLKTSEDYREIYYSQTGEGEEINE